MHEGRFAAEDESGDDDNDDVDGIEELERRMWRDRVQHKRLKELQQSRIGRESQAADTGGAPLILSLQRGDESETER